MSFHLNAHNLRFPSQTENLGLWCISNSGEIMGRLKIRDPFTASQFVGKFGSITNKW